MTMEKGHREMQHCQLCRWKNGLWAKIYGQLVEARKEEEMDSPLEPLEINTALLTP